jgi:hypothetical protein
MNELLVRTIYYANSIIYMGMIYFAFTFVFKPRIKIIWISLAYIAYIIISSELFLLFGNIWINITVNTAAFLSFAFLFKGRLYARFVLAILVYAMGMLADLISFIILNYFYFTQHGMEVPHHNVQTIGRSLVNIVFLPFLAITVILFRKIFAQKAIQKHYNVPKGYTLSVLFVILGIMLIIVLFVSSVDDFYANSLNLGFIFILSLLIILSIIWLYNAILNHLKMLEESKTRDYMLERWESQYKAARYSQSYISKLNHNLHYDFVTLGGYLKNGEIEKAEKHIENHIGELVKIINTGNISIDAMLNYFQQRVKETLDIEIKAELLIPPDLNIDSVHIVTILGNAIENAIEACERLEHDKRYIHVKAAIKNKNSLFITITNPYSVEPIVDKNGNLATTKEDKRNHGIGLTSISDIMPAEKGQIYYEYADNVFKFMVIFYDVVDESAS